jgi:hypothetical protein
VATWVDEGVAEWVSGDTDDFYLTEAVVERTFDRRLPRDFEFITGPDDAILGAYEESSAGARYAVEQFGPDEVADFYRLLGRARVAPGTSRYHVDRAMQATWAVPFGAFQARWADWVEAEI